MPTVTKYERRAGATALPGARLTAAETAISQGAGVAQAREQRALVGARIGENVRVIGQRLYAFEQQQEREEREKARQTAIRTNYAEGQNALSKYLNDYNYGDNGAMKRTGKNAFSLPEESRAAFEQAAAAIETTMGSPEAKALFHDYALSQDVQQDLQVQRHVANQQQAYTAQVTKARVENGIEEAVRQNTTMGSDGTFDIETARKTIADTVVVLRQNGEAMGMDKETIDGQVETMMTKVHEGTIGIYAANGNMQAARAYYAEMKGEMDTDAQERTEKVLRAGGVKKEAQTETERIVEKFGTGPEARAEAKKIKDPDVQDEVVSRIEHEHAVKEQQKREEHETLLNTLANKVRATKSAVFTPQEMAGLSATEHQMFREYAHALVTGIPVKTDAQTYYDLYEMARTQPQEFLKLNLMNYRMRLSDSDLQELTRVRGAISAGDKKAADEAMSGYMTESQIVTEVLRTANLDPSPKEGTVAATNIANLRLAVNAQVRAWKALNPGKTMSAEQTQQIADDMLKQAVTQKGTGSLWSFVKFNESYSDVTKRIGLLTWADMTADDKKYAADYLRQIQQPVTAENMLNVHKRMKAAEARAAQAQGAK